MRIPRNKETTVAPKLAFRCGVSAAVWIASVLSVPIIPLGNPASALGSLVPPVTETPALSLPSAAPAQTSVPTVPQAPVMVPTVPQAPVETSLAPQASGARSTETASSGVDLPSVNQMANGTGESAGAASAASAAGAQQTAASARNRVGQGSGARDATRLGTEAGSVESAKVAPLRRFLAYIWPAIALGPTSQLVATLRARWEAASSAVSDVPRGLSGLTAATGAGGVAGISAHSATPSSAEPTATGTWVPDGSAISQLVFIVLGAALIALLVFTIRRELRSMAR